MARATATTETPRWADARDSFSELEQTVKKRQDELEDEYYEYNDDRPTLEPVERPTVDRCERPMRTPAGSRMGPSREKAR
jgi:hypothetical protein